MRVFSGLSIKWKLTWIIMIASLTPLLLSSMAFIGYELLTFRASMVRDLSSEAEIIGSNNRVNLSIFQMGIDTRDDAEQTLRTLEANPHIMSAAIYAGDNKVLAKYAREPAFAEIPNEPLNDTYYFEDDYLALFKPITKDSDSLGTIYIKSDLKELRARVSQYIGIGMAFLLGSFVVAFILASVLQRIVSKPILELARTTSVVSKDKDYSVRAEKTAEDEVGLLIDGFNDMLSQIQQRDEELRTATNDLRLSKEKLQDYSRNLEAKVDQRTQELKEKNLSLQEAVEKLKQMQNQVVMQEKLASLGTLTAGIAHEIKNPLNFVNNFAELSAGLIEELREDILKQRGKLDAETVENIEDILADLEQNAARINSHGKRADSIVRNMLQLSRGKPGETQITDVNALLDEYVSLAYHGMRAKDASFNITINKAYDETLQPVEAVPQDLSRVFLNILNNACYAAHQKKIELADNFTPTLGVSTKNVNGGIEIRIRDNGKGIPKDHLKEIFNPFFSTKPTGEGTGLGLSISYDIIVQEHKGEIKVETKEGSFTEFIISLPRAGVKARAEKLPA